MNRKKDNSRDADDPLGDLPEWLEEFTDNPEDTEVPASANTSHDSDSGRPAKVAARKHGSYSHFPEDRNCEVCLRTKMSRAVCRKAHWRSSTSSRKSLVT